MRRLLALLGLLLMADGITEPVTTILCQNNANADAGGDGFYDAADFFAKFPARFSDLLTVPSKTYRALDSIQNGDAVGAAATYVRFLDCSVKFDSGKTYIVGLVPVGSDVNRALYLGEKVGTASVWKGANLEFTGGGALTIRGQLYIYDSRLFHATQSFNLIPSVSGQGEIIQGTIELRGQGINNIGNATIAFGPIRGLALIHRVTTLNNTLNIPDCIGLTIYPLAGSQYGLRPTGLLSVNGLTFAKGGQTIADMLPISAAAGITDWDVNNITWSQIVPGISGINNSGFNFWEGATANFLVVDPRTMTAVQNIALEIVDRLGNTVVDVDTNAAGQIVYNSGTRANCLRYVRRANVAAALVVEDQFPWTVKVNHKRSVNLNFYPSTFQIVPQYTAYTGGRQFSPIGQLIPLTPILKGQEEWVPTAA